VRHPSSKLKVRIAELLKEEGFIKNFRVLEDKKQNMLRVYLKYGVGNEKMISGLVRVSTPGRRVYVTHDKIPSILAGMGVALVSTSKGVVTDREARKQKGRRRSPRLRVVGARHVSHRQETHSDSPGREGPGGRRASCAPRGPRAS